MRILYFMPHTSCGGCPAFALKRIETLLEYSDFQLFVIEYNDYGKFFPVQRDQIINLLSDRFYSLGNNKMFAIDIINRVNPDIIHFDELPELMDNDELFKKIYSNDRSWRIIETCHTSQFNPDTSKRFYPDLHSFCTPYHEDIFSNMDGKFITIPYPIDSVEVTDTDRFLAKAELGFKANKKNIINVGLWTPGKNQGEGIEIAREYPDMDFHFIGNMSENFRFYWEQLMTNLPDNVKIWGERSDISKFIMAADIFMFNSTLELNPLVIREALSFNLPIVARNLPQYGGMYEDYLYHIDFNLNSINKPKKIYVSDIDSSRFAEMHKVSYEKILEYPAQKQEVKINQHFVDQPFLEIKGISDSNFLVKFYDEQGKCHYDTTIKSNSWVRLDRQYYTKWTAKVYQDGSLIYKYTLNLANKTVFIVIDSKSLGDTIAWIPYALDFQKKHNCKVVVSTFWNHILDYPELELVEPGNSVNCYALYRIGYFYNKNKEPIEPNKIPLQQAASNILGLEFTEVAPRLRYNKENPNLGRYVTIATNSTAQCKFWQREDWTILINWLVDNGFKVINVSKEKNPFDNCEALENTSIENTMNIIANAKFQVSLSSGLSWLAYGLGTYVFMIANFTAEDYEFTTNCTRIVNKSVCHDCWSEYRLDAGNWSWCPRSKNFECHTSIDAEMVIDKIKQIL
jgi:autotransporter strand-loop-strand O-heptosyltransferase